MMKLLNDGGAIAQDDFVLPNRRTTFPAWSGPATEAEGDELPKQVVVRKNWAASRTVSSLSDDNDDGDDQEDSESGNNESITPPARRSIFGKSVYSSERTNDIKQARPILQRSASPMAVMEDPYQYFGIETPEQEAQLKMDRKQALENAYEHSLNQCEEPVRPKSSRYSNQPLWAKWFSNKPFSAPSLQSHELEQRPGLHRRQAQSESQLYRTPLKSCVRQGRFSQKATSQGAGESSHVHFQPVVKVVQYNAPVESWAEEGWSKWFN
eukprot:Nitzschia sp. Nitz4//scaffold257_size48314//18698//19498//NITZ4_007090-RA/size48314-processed-gene-0.4-mRNA-1//1//CDS//3329544451//6131//frame0